MWDDTTSTIAAWRDAHHVDPTQPGLGDAPTDPNEHEHWLDVMGTTLAQRAWLSDRDPHVTRAAIPALTPVEIHDRISQLDQLFADAPTDRSRIIDDLIAGHLSTPDLYDALSEARSAQTERDRWILANWPFIVEHHELHRLAKQHDPLAHWPSPVRPAVEAVLDRLAARLDPTPETEPRTLGELQAAVAALDPGVRLRNLTEQLVALNDGLRRVQADRDAETDPARTTLLNAEKETLRSSQRDVRTLISTERTAVNHQTYTTTDHDALRWAITRRTETIYQQAITERPEWLVALLTDLDDLGTLAQLRPGQIRELILDRATVGELGLHGPSAESERKLERVPVRAI